MMRTSDPPGDSTRPPSADVLLPQGQFKSQTEMSLLVLIAQEELKINAVKMSERKEELNETQQLNDLLIQRLSKLEQNFETTLIEIRKTEETLSKREERIFSKEMLAKNGRKGSKAISQAQTSEILELLLKIQSQAATLAHQNRDIELQIKSLESSITKTLSRRRQGIENNRQSFENLEKKVQDLDKTLETRDKEMDALAAISYYVSSNHSRNLQPIRMQPKDPNKYPHPGPDPPNDQELVSNRGSETHQQNEDFQAMRLECKFWHDAIDLKKMKDSKRDRCRSGWNFPPSAREAIEDDDGIIYYQPQLKHSENGPNTRPFIIMKEGTASDEEEAYGEGVANNRKRSGTVGHTTTRRKDDDDEEACTVKKYMNNFDSFCNLLKTSSSSHAVGDHPKKIKYADNRNI